MRYPEYKSLHLPKTAADVRAFWEEQGIFEQSVRQRDGAPAFTFYEGPPSANGTPGIHHVMARTIKDLFCRYKTLRGYQVNRKGGWDTHGLPVELQVERELGITKEDIGKKISIAEYNERCRQTVMRFTDQWNELTRLMGYWVDLDAPYVTYHNEYIESIWHLLQKFYDRGLLYKGYTIQPYSPAAGTGLSTHELNQPGCYRNVKDTSVVAQFEVIRETVSEKLFHGEVPVYFLAWTTTPWTLPANAALVVGAQIRYVQVHTFNPYTGKEQSLILAKDLAGKYFSEKQLAADLSAYAFGDKLIPARIVAEYSGAELLDIRYHQLLAFVQPDAPAFRVISGDFVTTEDGTGIVHCSPTFGADDFRVARQHHIPSILVDGAPIVDKRGRYVDAVQAPLAQAAARIFEGRLVPAFVKAEYEADDVQKDDKYISMDVLIATLLKTESKAFKVEKYEHSYPHCWRTDKPILYYPLESWFIKTTALKDRLAELNRTINWKPESTGTGRFGNWLENLVDWNLSRSRYWGTPLPVWRTDDGQEVRCIGSRDELYTAAAAAVRAGIMPANPLEDPAFDLHRPFVDDIVLVSPSGKPMYREADLIDVWFDSGAMPYAQWHYPFENQDIFERSFPADFISEGVDQTRGWFFTLHAIAGMLFDSVAFRNVVSTGLLLDKNGEKMSKRKGNVVDPFKALGEYGADAVRWYIIRNTDPWENLLFNLENITEVQRKFFGTLHNTYNFFALYANLAGYTPGTGSLPVGQRCELDRWVLSRLQSLVAETTRWYDQYEPTKAARAIETFTDELSNWYVRLSRKRFWKSEEGDLSAYDTLFECLSTVSVLMSPIAPFYAEQLYRSLHGQGPDSSVHLAQWPAIRQDSTDPELEARMTLAQDICSLIHSIRKGHNLRVRLPLSRILVPVLDPALRPRIAAVEDIIKSEVNVKAVSYIDDTDGILSKKVKPNFKVLGKKYGKRLQEVAKRIESLSQAQLSQLERQQTLALADDLVLALEDVEISTEDIAGWATARKDSLTVALDIALTPELEREGLARDFVNRIQNLRKDLGLDVQDKIAIRVRTDHAEFGQALTQFGEYICAEVQALRLDTAAGLQEAVTVEMEGFEIGVVVEKIS